MIETKKLFCRFCHTFCGIEVDVNTTKNRVVAIRGDKDNAVSEGYTCIKGRAEMDRIYHPDRLLSSKKRVDGKLKDIDPETALDEVAGKLRDIIDTHGPGSVAVYVGGAGYRMSTCGPEFLRKWLDALGSPGLYTSFTVDSPGICVAAHRLWGSLMPFSLFDMPRADVCLLIGTNPLVSHLFNIPQPNGYKRLKNAKRRGMKLIVIDPRRSEVARESDLFLQVKPGEDATLLAAMIKIIIDKGLYDKPYVEAFGSGLDALQKAVGDFDLEYAARRTQIPSDLIREAAETFATAGSGAAIAGIGVNMSRHQNLTIQLVLTLNGLCGRYDRKGGMVHQPGVLMPELPENPEPIPLPLFPGPESRIRGIRGINGFLGILEMPSNCLADEILTPGEGQIRALIVNGGNPALVFPDEKGTLKALENIDLLVVNELFEAETAWYADYVFALKHPFEQTDIPRLLDSLYPFPFMQYTQPIVQAPEGLLDGYEVFWGLAKRLGIQLDIPGISMDTKPTADEMLEGLFPTPRIPFEKLRKYPGGHVWGEIEPRVGHILPSMIGHADKRIALGHPEAMKELRDVRAEPVIDKGGYDENEDFAFRMIHYRMGEVYVSQGRNMKSLHERAPYNPVMMNPEDMEGLGVGDGDRVRVETDYGNMEGIVKGAESLKSGVIAVAPGWGHPDDKRDISKKGSNVQRLIPDDYRYDPTTGLALMTAIPVNVVAVK